MKSVEKMKDKKEMVLYHGSGNNYDNPILLLKNGRVQKKKHISINIS